MENIFISSLKKVDRGTSCSSSNNVIILFNILTIYEEVTLNLTKFSNIIISRVKCVTKSVKSTVFNSGLSILPRFMTNVNNNEAFMSHFL